jgi:hypothetical protein
LYDKTIDGSYESGQVVVLMLAVVVVVATACVGVAATTVELDTIVS